MENWTCSTNQIPALKTSHTLIYHRIPGTGIDITDNYSCIIQMHLVITRNTLYPVTISHFKIMYCETLSMYYIVSPHKTRTITLRMG